MIDEVKWLFGSLTRGERGWWGGTSLRGAVKKSISTFKRHPLFSGITSTRTGRSLPRSSEPSTPTMPTWWTTSPLLTPSHPTPCYLYPQVPHGRSFGPRHPLLRQDRAHEAHRGTTPHIGLEARDHGTKLLHRKSQPAIDALVLELQREFNDAKKTEIPGVFKMYDRCYLKDALYQIATNPRRSKRSGFHFTAKLMQEAYIVHERKCAKRLDRPSPIHDTVDNTHRCYDDAADLFLRHHVHHGTSTEVVIATHNETSIAHAVLVIDELDLASDDGGVHFAQLYRMSDKLTFALGRGGYNAFKYLPYGKVDEVVPYLVRRAQENRDMLGNVTKEMVLLREELGKSVLVSYFLSSTHGIAEGGSEGSVPRAVADVTDHLTEVTNNSQKERMGLMKLAQVRLLGAHR
ncbi:hypothetical protein ACHAWF_009410 [Thalassiosira exigua]